MARALVLVRLLNESIDEVGSLIFIFSTPLRAGKICITRNVWLTIFVRRIVTLYVVYRIGRERVRIVLIVHALNGLPDG